MNFKRYLATGSRLLLGLIFTVFGLNFFLHFLPQPSAPVGVVAELGRQVEGDGEPGLAFLQQVTEALVRLLGGAVAGVLAHAPQPAAVHGRLDAAGERKLARSADIPVRVGSGEVAGGAVGPFGRGFRHGFEF